MSVSRSASRITSLSASNLWICETCISILAVEFRNNSKTSRNFKPCATGLSTNMELGLKNHEKDGEFQNAGVYVSVSDSDPKL